MLTRHLHFFSIVLVLSHYCSVVVGQTVEDTAAAGNSFVKIEKEAYYRGGEKAWMQYIADNLELKESKKRPRPENTPLLYSLSLQLMAPSQRWNR